MSTRWLLIAASIAAALLTGVALLHAPEYLTQTDDDPSQRLPSEADIYDALSGVAHFTVFGDSQATSLSGTAYVAEGMLRLATALQTLAQRDGFDSGRFDTPQKLRRAADELRTATENSDTPTIARDALTLAAVAATDLQKEHYPHLARAVATLSSAAARLRTDRTLEDQHATIAAYFDAASDALTPMILGRK